MLFFPFNLDGEIKADVPNMSIFCPLVAKNYNRRTGNKIHEFYFKNNNISIRYELTFVILVVKHMQNNPAIK